MTAVSMVMETLEIEWPDWANSLLPLPMNEVCVPLELVAIVTNF